MLTQILTHTPVFVWAILGGLVLLGLSQARTRKVSPARAAAMPLVLMGLGLWSLAAGFQAMPVVALVWLASLALGAWGGRLTPQAPGTAWLAHEGRFVVPGSWIPLAFTVFVFTLRYCAAVGTALHPQWTHDLSVQLPLATVFGLVSGLSAGRVLGLVRLMQPASAKAARIGAHA